VATPIYSTNFFAIAGFQGQEYFDVPAGLVVIVRDITCYMGGTRDSSSTFWLHDTTNGNVAVFWFYQAALENAQYVHWTGRQVFTAGTQWDVQVVGAPADIRVSGYILTAP
jgi:hypothetical protein